MRDEPERQERQERHSLLAPERETPPRVSARPRAGMAAALAAMLVMAGYLVLGKYYVGKHIAHGTSANAERDFLVYASPTSDLRRVLYLPFL